MGNEFHTIQSVAYGGRKRTLRKRTRRGGQDVLMVVAGGRKRTRRGGQTHPQLIAGRKRTRRGGQTHPQLIAGRKRTRRGGQIVNKIDQNTYVGLFGGGRGKGIKCAERSSLIKYII
jgi:hypothetical protein